VPVCTFGVCGKFRLECILAQLLSDLPFIREGREIGDKK
jgi:hypothetical protein